MSKPMTETVTTNAHNSLDDSGRMITVLRFGEPVESVGVTVELARYLLGLAEQAEARNARVGAAE